MLIILFGLSGSGKNFVGDILAEKFNYFFWDADTILPDEMLACIKKQTLFTQEMRDNFTKSIIQKIAQLQKQHTNLVVAQAFYKEQNRQQVLNAFPDAKLINIKAEATIIVARLLKNNKSINAAYAKKISVNLEETQLPHQLITNNSDANAVIAQLKNILNYQENLFMQTHSLFSPVQANSQFALFCDQLKKYCEDSGCKELTFTENELKQLQWFQTSDIVTPEVQGQGHYDPLHFEIKRAVARRFSFELLLQEDSNTAYQKFVKDQPAPDRLSQDDFNQLAGQARQLSEDVKTVVRLSCLFSISEKAKAAVAQYNLSNDSEEFLTQVAAGMVDESNIINKNVFPITSDLTNAQVALLIKIYWPKMHLRAMVQTEGPDNITSVFGRGITQGAFSVADFNAWKWRWYTVSFGFAAGSGAKYYDKNIHLLTQMVIVELEKSFEQPSYFYLDGYLAERARLASLDIPDNVSDHAVVFQEQCFLGHLAAFSNKVHVINIETGLALYQGFADYQKENSTVDLPKSYHLWRKIPNAVTPTYVTSVYSNAYDLIYKQHIAEQATPDYARKYALRESTHFICQVLTTLYQFPCEIRISMQKFASDLPALLPGWQKDHTSLELRLSGQFTIEAAIRAPQLRLGMI